MESRFIIESQFQPTGDQPAAIKALSYGVDQGTRYQTLLGVTGSGKTFTIANVIEQVQRPTLVLSHNKTLAAQLYNEFKFFFPNNRVEYFVSYYDYYQPEAYIPVTNTYIEKDLSINDEIERLRLSATSALLSGRKDVIIVSSVSCIYGIGNPDDFHGNTISLNLKMKIPRNVFLRRLVDSLYSRNEVEFKRGTFRVKGDIVDIHLAYDEIAYRVEFWGEEIEGLSSFNPINGKTIAKFEEAVIFPANIFVTGKERVNDALRMIEKDLFEQVDTFKNLGKMFEAKRLQERVSFDLEMLRELGHCTGIENYSRYFDGRNPGSRPFCLIDYFPKDFMLVIDESHVTLPQIRAMYGGDFSRKKNLVEFGFRLSAAIDNRPLKFEEFMEITGQTIFVSATPSDFELEKSGGVIVEQLIRPTGVLDPLIEIRPSLNQIDDLMNEINLRTQKDERVLVTTLTKRMAEELTLYLSKASIRCQYIHSDVDTLERIDILDNLRSGRIDVLIGVNLLREGIDLPQVSLVAILDADKEGFLRSERALVQTSGRAARNVNGLVIMYADKITDSMQRTIDETMRKREIQMRYNIEHNITPTQIGSRGKSVLAGSSASGEEKNYYIEKDKIDVAADPLIKYMDKAALKKLIDKAKKSMEEASGKLDFIEAARYRDEMFQLEKLWKEK